ncbi:MAG: hypothetical protein AABW73_03895 [Nanoarchaeota archaeon]
MKERSKLILGFIGLFSITGITAFLTKQGIEALVMIKDTLNHAL